MSQAVWDDMDGVYKEVVDGHKGVDPVPPPGGGLWKGLDGKYTFESPKTAVDLLLALLGTMILANCSGASPGSDAARTTRW